MILLNFSHPITQTHLNQIENLIHIRPELKNIPVQIDQSLSLKDEIDRIVTSAGFTSEEWQTVPILVNLPGLSVLSCGIVAELHGRMGHFPDVLRLKPMENFQGYEVAEIVSLQKIRDRARINR